MREPRKERRDFGCVDFRSPTWPQQLKELEKKRAQGKREALYKYRAKRKKEVIPRGALPAALTEPVRFNMSGYVKPPGYSAGPFRTYKMTMNEIAKMHQAQNGKCANLGCLTDIPVYGRGRAVDHDWKTGAVRGMLCKQCNLALGLLRDDPRRMIGLVAYLGHLDPKLLK